MDYGHQHYLDQLQSQEGLVLKALEKPEIRTAEVILDQTRLFKCIQNLESEENARRENQKAKIKREAALFQHHQKEVTVRTKELRVSRGRQIIST
jgi:hypothetical protein